MQDMEEDFEAPSGGPPSGAQSTSEANSVGPVAGRGIGLMR
jgi:hypothetical protein